MFFSLRFLITFKWRLRKAWSEIAFADGDDAALAAEENAPVSRRVKEAEEELWDPVSSSLEGSTEAKKAELDPVSPHKRSKETENDLSSWKNAEPLDAKSFRRLPRDLSETYEVTVASRLGKDGGSSLKRQAQLSRLGKKAFAALEKIPLWR
jgi:hypothetical protein